MKANPRHEQYGVAKNELDDTAPEQGGPMDRGLLVSRRRLLQLAEQAREGSGDGVVLSSQQERGYKEGEVMRKG